jgi:hypothetical protein
VLAVAELQTYPDGPNVFEFQGRFLPNELALIPGLSVGLYGCGVQHFRLLQDGKGAQRLKVALVNAYQLIRNFLASRQGTSARTVDLSVVTLSCRSRIARFAATFSRAPPLTFTSSGIAIADRPHSIDSMLHCSDIANMPAKVLSHVDGGEYAKQLRYARFQRETPMRLIVRTALVFGAVFVSTCASTPRSTMLVPSRTTIPELEKLSREANTTADAITVNRETYLIQLDGAGAQALTGRNIGDNRSRDNSGNIVRIPFDELALVYYPSLRLPRPEKYPLLPIVGAAEQRLSCDELAVELGRTGAIRWYARRQGAMPFTESEAVVQHTKNAGIFAAKVALSAVIVGSLAFGGGGDVFDGEHAPPVMASVEAFRWAVTAADRRELGLLRLKRDHHCAAQDASAGADLSILEQIEQSNNELSAKRVTDQQQMDLQTRLLDLLDPPHEDSAAAAKRIAHQLFQGDGDVLAVFSDAVWYPNASETSILKAATLEQTGVVIITKSSVAFLRGSLPTDASRGTTEADLRIPYSAIVAIGVKGCSLTWFSGFCAATITQTGGRIDWFGIPNREWAGLDRPKTEAAAEMLRSAVRAFGR